MGDNATVAVKHDNNQNEWVEVPATDIFDQPHNGVSVNFTKYGPGKHFLPPELAGEVRRLLKSKEGADIRVLQPKRDQKAIDIMNRTGRG